MQQIVDLQNDPDFQSLDVQLISIAFDSQEELNEMAAEYDVGEIPLLTDSNKAVSATYDVLQWAVASGEPGHTFVLVNEEGKIVWIRDYGAPENGGVMYVEIPELVDQISTHLN
jgi:peroxiredoxin